MLERQRHAEHLRNIILNLCENYFNFDSFFFAHQLSSPYTLPLNQKKKKETSFCLVVYIRYSFACIYTFSGGFLFATHFNLVCRCKQSRHNSFFICLVSICISSCYMCVFPSTFAIIKNHVFN